MKIRLLLLSLLFGLTLIGFPVKADVLTADITITATGIVIEAPLGFSVWIVSSEEIGAAWTKPVGAVNTMIRAEYGRYPIDRTDGYLVYYGPADSVSDTTVNFDEVTSTVNYRAWSENAANEWSDYAQDYVEGIGVTLIAFVILVVGMTIATFALKSGRMIMAFVSAGAWALMGIYCYTLSIQTWDIYYSIFWLSMGMTLVCSLIPTLLREKKENDIGIEDEDDDAELMADIESHEKDREKYDRLFGRSKHRKRKNFYARTGLAKK